MSKFGSLILNGKSGSSYSFQTWPLGTQFRAVGAVFFVTKRYHNQKTTFRRANHELIFVGETASMAEPLGPTALLDDFDKHGANCVCVYASNNPVQRRHIVEDLVAGQRPLLRSRPPAEPLPDAQDAPVVNV